MVNSETYGHPILAHLMPISAAAKAHTRYDLAIAIWKAFGDYRALFGHNPDMTGCKKTVVSDETDAAFREAALAFIDQHHSHQRGWRRFVLRLFHAEIKLLRSARLPVFQSWRKTAWNDACSWVETAESV
jgi:hypothetical protein